MLKIAICDDKESDRNQLSKLILLYTKQTMLDAEVDKYGSGEALLEAYPNLLYPIVFLDIFMGGLSGVDAAVKIRKINPDCMLIFTTQSPDYMAAGFNVGATHYLLKPLTYEKVEQALDRCRRIFSENARYFCVTSDRRTVRIRFCDVLYVEVYGKFVLIHTVRGDIKTYTSLSEISNMIGDGSFLQCHRCYIVNMNAISSVRKESFVLDNGMTVPIRRKGRQELKDAYSRFFLTELRRQ